MADINVERKGASIWPWILGLLVAALLIWALMALFDGEDDALPVVDPNAEVVAPAPMPAPADSLPTFQPVPDAVGDTTGAAAAGN